jgi:hypothetical protein
MLSCTWKRPDITKIFIDKLLEVENATSDYFNFTNIIIDSENSNLDNFKNNDKFIYKNYKNFPVSNKWNFGSSLLEGIDFDYVLIIGSDDFIDSNLLIEYNKKMKENYDQIGIIDLFVFDVPSDKLFYWGGYNEKSGRKGETVGLGRCLSKSLVEKLEYNLWEPGLNKGLDASMQKKIIKLPDIKSITLELKNNFGFACDIKNNTNITPLDTFKHAVIELDRSLFFDDNFNLIYDINKIDLKSMLVVPTTFSILLNRSKIGPPQKINYEKVNDVVKKRETQKTIIKSENKNTNVDMAQNLKAPKKQMFINSKPTNTKGGKDFLKI